MSHTINKGPTMRRLVVLLAVAAAMMDAGLAEDALTVCRRMLSDPPPSTPRLTSDLFFSTGSTGQDFVVFNTKSPNNYTLTNAMYLSSISPVKETSAKTTLCVGLVDTTSYTYIDGIDGAVAWVTLHTKREQSSGLVEVDSACWRERKRFSECNPSYNPLSFIVNLPQYHYSILEEEFWYNFTLTDMGISDTWVWKINTQTKHEKIKIESDWLFKMDIPSLEKLEIYGNDWRKPKNLFRPMPKLDYLDISYNNLGALPQGMLQKMPRLQILILGHNIISEYPMDVKNLNLRILDLTNPIGDANLTIADADVENLPRSLQILGLENTKLNANVTKILLLPQLSFLNLSGCLLGKIPDYDFSNSTNDTNSSTLITIDLSFNSLTALPTSIFMRLKVLKILKLHHNDLSNWPVEIDLSTLVDLILSNNLICHLSRNNFRKLNQLEKLDLSWNCLENIPSNIFENNTNLKMIDLSHNKIEYIDKNVFNNLEKLTEIKISNNFLKSFPPQNDMKLDNLDLSFNAIKSFTNFNSTIKYVDISQNSISILFIQSVEKLNMSFNNISVISPSMWKNITLLKEVDLGGIAFECCLFGNSTFMKENTVTVVKNLGTFNPLTCSVNKTSPKILLRTFVYNESECSLAELQDASLGLETFLPIGILIVAICLVATMLYIYRFEITYLSHLFQMKKVGNISDEDRYENCAYDAFVCYSAKNFAWVAGRLLPSLERPPFAYRLCVHDRDFALGTAIHRNIVASLEKSRKVILVLSSDFIASKWCQWELEMANHKMFEEKRNTIVLVELEPLDRRALPRHLRYLMARTTYLQWPWDGDLWGQLPGEVNVAFDVDENFLGDVALGKKLGKDDVDGRRQRLLRREEACLKRLRDALGESLSQRRGTNAQSIPHTVLDASS